MDILGISAFYHDSAVCLVRDGEIVALCAAKNTCLYLDPACSDVESRDRLFAPDRHWNEAGMHAARTYLWTGRLQLTLSAQAVDFPDFCGHTFKPVSTLLQMPPD
jgi:hypothetical protein